MRNLMIAAVALLFLAGTACIQYDQVVTLNKDGSGSVSIHYAMSEAMVNQMKMMAQMAEQMAQNVADSTGGQAQPAKEKNDMDKFSFEPDKVRKNFQDLKKEGITLTELKSFKKDGWEHMKLVFKFKDVLKLRKVTFFEDSDMTITKNAKGNYVIRSKSGKDGKEEKSAGSDAGDSDTGSEGQSPDMGMDQMMMGMMKGFRVSITYVTPTPIVYTTAPQKEKNKAIWTFDIEKDAKAMETMEQEEMVIEFSGRGVTIPEMK